MGRLISAALDNSTLGKVRYDTARGARVASVKKQTPAPDPIAAAAERWREVADYLRAHPGEWHRVAKNDVRRSVGANIRRGQLRAFRPVGAFEAATRLEDGKVRVFARYVGAPIA